MDNVHYLTQPEALLLLAPGCPHCPSVMESLCALVKEGIVGRLEIINIAAQPEQAQAMGAKTVPWMRIGLFEFEGLMSLGELRRWALLGAGAQGAKTYFLEMLKSGRRDKVESMIRNDPRQAAFMVALLVDADASMAVRLGIGAVLEEFNGTGLTDSMIPGLGELALHGDRLTRADTCHFLSLIGGAAVVPYLRQCLNDEDSEVRDIAQEALGNGVDKSP